jgi:Na+-translocating ferredoxin:NAD+ oxidoreductase RnfC subunit
MMPGPLPKARHEAFVRGLFEGKSAVQAYADAGYKPCRQSAHKLLTKADVQARLAELQEEAAKQSEVTVASLIEELEAARVKATDLNQLSAAVRATAEKAKISGLLVERKAIELNATIDVYAEAATHEEVLIKVVEDIGLSAAAALAAAFKLPYDQAAIQAMCDTPRHNGNGHQAIEWTPPRKQVRREP